MTDALRVLVADDSVLLREGLVRLLEESGCEVVAQAGDAEDLLRKTRAHKPTVAIIDVRMPPDNSDDGIRAALTIRREQPEIGLLVLSQYIEEQYAIELIGEAHDGVGYLLKERITDVDTLLDAVHRIAGGGSVIDPQVVSQLLRRRQDMPRRSRPAERDDGWVLKQQQRVGDPVLRASGDRSRLHGHRAVVGKKPEIDEPGGGK